MIVWGRGTFLAIYLFLGIRDIYVGYPFQYLTQSLRYLTPQSPHLGSGMADWCITSFNNEISPAYRS
jgi:hypothetical protein